MKSVVKHLERFLGRIEFGWSCDENGRELPFQIVRLSKGPVRGTKTFSTLGLSNYELTSRISEKMIRHELVFLVRARDGRLGIPGILQQVALNAISEGIAYLRGDVIGPRDPIAAESKMSALYVSIPVYFKDRFSVCESKELGPVVFAWLVPISAREALYVENEGWPSFEDRLMQYDPDLLDIFREELPL